MSAFLSMMPRFETTRVSLDQGLFCVVLGRAGGAALGSALLESKGVDLLPALSQCSVQHTTLDDREPSLSRHHALLCCDGCAFFLHPWWGGDGEFHPLRLNNQPLLTARWSKLCDGDVIELGAIRVIFRVESNAPEKKNADAIPPASSGASATVRMKPRHQKLRTHMRHTIALFGDGLEDLFLCAEQCSPKAENFSDQCRDLVEKTLGLFMEAFHPKERSFFYKAHSVELGSYKGRAEAEADLTVDSAPHRLSLGWSEGGTLLFSLVLEGTLSDDGAFDEFDSLLFDWLAKFTQKIWKKVFLNIQDFFSVSSSSMATTSSAATIPKDHFFFLTPETNVEKAVMEYSREEWKKKSKTNEDLVEYVTGLENKAKAFFVEFQFLCREIAKHKHYKEAGVAWEITDDTVLSRINKFSELMGLEKSAFQQHMRNLRGLG